MILVIRPSATSLAGLLERLVDVPVTYDEVGATRFGTMPAGYRHQRATTEIGRGDAAWARAKEALLTWQVHRRAGLSIYPAGAPLQAGTVVVAGAHLGPLSVLIPCRVVYVTEEATRFGFAYGTLPGHPERGGEAFHVTCDAQGVIEFEVVAFSRAGHLVTKLAGPLSHMAQSTATRRYLDGMRAFVSAGPTAPLA